MISESERAAYERLNIPMALCSIVDGNIHAELVSDAQCAYFGLTREEMLAALKGGMYSYTHPEDGERLVRATEDFLFRRRDKLDIVFRNRRNENADYHLNLAVSRWQTMEDGSEYAMLIYLDLSEAESGVSQILMLYGQSPDDAIYKDANTGLYNLYYTRQFADSCVRRYREAGREPMVITYDVKNMQTYNINYGYTNGDKLFRLVADVLRKNHPDGVVCRGEDDGFFVFDAFTTEEEVSARIHAVNEEVVREAYGTTKGIRAGVVVLLPQMLAVNAFDAGRTALSEISDDLNAVVSFYASENDDIYWFRRYIIDSFDQALENHWIKVFYQAMVRTKTGKMTGLEALARWIDPNRGMIPPNDFIPLLSHNHLLYRLDLYMVEQVCREFGVRAEAGLPLLPVSVNFSAQDFDHADITAELDKITERYNVPRRDIVIEITEHDLAQGTERFKEQLQELRAHGYHLWIDDFGSGYSSLSVFSQYEVERIKFDMDLLRHLDDRNGANRAILRAFTGVCRELGVRTLAEGVETAEQLAFLKEIDCELCQGYFFFRPSPVEDAVFKAKRRGPTQNYELTEERRTNCDNWLVGK